MGTSSRKVPNLLVHSEVDSGPMGVPGPSRRPKVWSHPSRWGYSGWRFPYCPTFGQPPSSRGQLENPNRLRLLGKKDVVLVDTIPLLDPDLLPAGAAVGGDQLLQVLDCDDRCPLQGLFSRIRQML